MSLIEISGYVQYVHIIFRYLVNPF